MYDSTTPPDPQANPMGFYQQQQQANQLLQQAKQPGKSGAGYVQQLASALAGGYKMNQLRDAANASSLLNGGPGVQSPLSQVGTRVMGMFGG